jgi:uncharacterized membrane protein YraQ (UPF0718 family)
MFWLFIQDEILGMRWLDRLVGIMLTQTGVDVDGTVGGSLQFFIYDSVKIMTLLCVLIPTISFVQSFFPPERSKRILGRYNGLGARLVAALLGTVTPFCSCSSIPLFIGFTTAGLPLGVTFSFLISSPMVDIGSLVLLTSVFGAKIAVVYTVLGVIFAVAGGTLIEKLRLEDQIEDFIRDAQGVSVSQTDLQFRDRLVYARDQTVQTVRKVFLYVLIGVGVGAIVHNWIPEEWVVAILGDENPFGVLVATIVGAPMYADIFGAIPVAEALLGKGALLGVVLSFMMAVTTLSLPSMIMLKKVVKAKLLGIFIAVCVVGIVLIGYLFNYLNGTLI